MGVQSELTNREMQRVYPDLTAKTVMVLTEDGIYKRESDGRWYLLQGSAVSTEDTAPLSGVDRPGEAGPEGMMTRPRDGAPGKLAHATPELES